MRARARTVYTRNGSLASTHRRASSYVARARRLLRGFRGWAYWITRSLDRENIPRGWQYADRRFWKDLPRSSGRARCILSTCLPTPGQIGDDEDDDERHRQLRDAVDSLRHYPPPVCQNWKCTTKGISLWRELCDVLRRRRHVTKMKHLGSRSVLASRSRSPRDVERTTSW